MKSIPVEQLGDQMNEALEQQDEREAIGLTKDNGTVAWIVRVPEDLRGSETNITLYGHGPDGSVLVVMEAKRVAEPPPDPARRTPVFGAGRGTLTILSEDDDHLKDFQEYME